MATIYRVIYVSADHIAIRSLVFDIRLTCCYFYLLVLVSCSSQFISNLPSSAFKYSVLVQCNNEFLLLVLGYILGYCSSIRFYLTLNPIEYVSWKEGSEVCATLHFNDHTLLVILVFYCDGERGECYVAYMMLT